MKKILCLALTVVMLLAALAGCGNTNTSGTLNTQDVPSVPGESGASWMDSLSGTDMAKLLLANQRLDAAILDKEGNIFDNGEKVMYNLIDIATANLGVQYGGETHEVFTLNNENTTVETIVDSFGVKVEIGDKTVRWSNFGETNNSYGAFLSITDNIVTEAKVGAELIGFVKKNIRVVNKWVIFGDTRYYLQVDSNSEALYEYRTQDNHLEFVKRYKNESGKDVYEMYSKTEGTDPYEMRMLYIPGERYEFIDKYWNFTADNSKGYWEIYNVGDIETRYNASYFIMKDNICYDAFYDPKTGSIPMLKVMSEDRKADLMNITKGDDILDVTLKYSGFDGIAYVETPRDNIFKLEDGTVLYDDYSKTSLVMQNGKTIKIGDEFYEGNICVNQLALAMTSIDGYIGELGFTVKAETYEEQIELLRRFLSDNGFVCRRDIDGVFDGIDLAYEELDSIIKYYCWHGVNVSDEEGIAKAFVKEKARMSALYVEYESIKDKEVIEFTSEEDMEIHINFASIIDKSAGSAAIDGTKVNVPVVALTVSDTTLFVENEPYKVFFALKAVGGGLVHLDSENTATTAYAGEKEFTVSAENISFELPEISAGEYTVVCYISTADGIRASGYTELAFSEVKNLPVTLSSSELSAVIGEGGALTLTYTEKRDHYVDISTEKALDFEAFKQLVGEEVFKYGTPKDELIEKLAGEEWLALTGEETEMESGTYRIFYSAKNGDKVTEGYVYITYNK